MVYVPVSGSSFEILSLAAGAPNGTITPPPGPSTWTRMSVAGPAGLFLLDFIWMLARVPATASAPKLSS